MAKKNTFNGEKSTNQDELDLFKVNEVKYRQTPFWSRVLLLAISGSVLFGFIYACIARIDEVVMAKGELQAFGAERPIRANISGLISEISVKEGDVVSKGQLLLKFDTRVLNIQLVSLNEKLKSLKRSYKIESDINQRLTELAFEGAISSLEALRQENKLQEIEASIAQVEARINELNIEIAKIHLRAPLEGRVFNLIPASTGYAATNGETLLKIVPGGDLEAKIFISNSDIGFISPSMKAKVRIDAYPFTQFGSIDGKIRSIGDEVLQANSTYPFSRFPAYLSLDNQYLEKEGIKYKVRSGQSVSVNIIVRDKPIISIITNTIGQAFDSLRGIKSDR
jgi:HlyD family secretion protein